jgi:hypothetical protein
MTSTDPKSCPFLLCLKFIDLYDKAIEAFPDKLHLPANLEICMNWTLSWMGTGTNHALAKASTKQCLLNQTVAFVANQLLIQIALLVEQLSLKMMDEAPDGKSPFQQADTV